MVKIMENIEKQFRWSEIRHRKAAAIAESLEPNPGVIPKKHEIARHNRALKVAKKAKQTYSIYSELHFENIAGRNELPKRGGCTKFIKI